MRIKFIECLTLAILASLCRATAEAQLSDPNGSWPNTYGHTEPSITDPFYCVASSINFKIECDAAYESTVDDWKLYCSSLPAAVQSACFEEVEGYTNNCAEETKLFLEYCLEQKNSQPTEETPKEVLPPRYKDWI